MNPKSSSLEGGSGNSDRSARTWCRVCHKELCSAGGSECWQVHHVTQTLGFWLQHIWRFFFLKLPLNIMNQLWSITFISLCSRLTGSFVVPWTTSAQICSFETFFTVERGSLHPPLVSWGITDNFRLLPQWRCGFYAAVFIASHLVEFLHQHSEPWTPCKEQRVSQGLEET